MAGIERTVRKALCMLLDDRISAAQRLEALKLANEWVRLRPGRLPVIGVNRALDSEPVPRVSESDNRVTPNMPD